MARVADVVKEGVGELQRLLRDAKSSEEDDLKSLAETFDAISECADIIASKLSAADMALTGVGGGDESSGESSEE